MDGHWDISRGRGSVELNARETEFLEDAEAQLVRLGTDERVIRAVMAFARCLVIELGVPLNDRIDDRIQQDHDRRKYWSSYDL